MPRAHCNITPLKPQQIQRFWSYVNQTPGQGPDGECWEWTKGRTKEGYGQVGLNCQSLLAHRVAYFLSTGENPQQLLVCHKCDNPPCCNPKHLFLGDDATNKADQIAKGRMETFEQRSAIMRRLWSQGKMAHRILNPVFGSANPRTKVSDADVRAIRERRARGESSASLAQEFRISPVSVNRIAAGTRRQRVT